MGERPQNSGAEEPSAPEPAAVRPQPQPLPPAQPVVHSVPPVQAVPSGPPQRRAQPPAGATTSGTGSVLPRRVRQASLAPQLRAEAAQDSAPKPPAANRERSADEVRDRMAALQRGWQRGREGASPDNTTDDPSTSVPRTTPEGTGR